MDGPDERSVSVPQSDTVPAPSSVGGGSLGLAAEPWQLQMFRHTLKKRQKLLTVLTMLGPLQNQTCLLVTCGDNNGALNWHFRQAGGHWRWAEAEAESSDQINALVREPVAVFDKGDPRLPFKDGSFDVAVAIDVHEHLPSPVQLNRELARVTRPGGTILVTTPSGDPTRLANRLKRWLGMRKEDYGHVVDGYDLPALEQQLRQARLQPRHTASYSGFFTELVELMINVAYVKVMARRSRARVLVGQIAPQNQAQLKSVGKSYRLYGRFFPLLRALASLDRLGGSRRGHAVVVLATKD
jgi:SAM-dependent methyltransferase